MMRSTQCSIETHKKSHERQATVRPLQLAKTGDEGDTQAKRFERTKSLQRTSAPELQKDCLL